MRIELGISAVIHTVILVAGAVALPSAVALKTKEPPPLPVEIFTVAEFTKLAARKTEIEPERNAPAVETEVEPEEPPPIVVDPPKAVEPETPPPAKVAALEPPPAPIEALPPEPLPLPEPEVVAEPEPEPEPEPVPEPEPEPAAAPEPAPQPAPEPEPKIVEAPPPPTAAAPAPRKKPKPPKIAKAPKKNKPPKAAKKKTFNPDKIAALLNKVQDDAGPSPAPAAGRLDDGARDISGLDLVITQSEMRYLQNQMQRCWNPPVGVANAASLNVKVEVRFDRGGRLEARPVVLNSGGEGFDVAANAAVRAVLQCQPYDMPAEKYDNWRQVIVNFDPQFMLGG
ncbi:hypothetical protein MNBD_ALPHA09-1753 [hydrothermal vent metagenome]|uniref:TolA protein n=1 Tax=hydrothermal vent metagenome TaxID=652676 RepID=A0A3B0T490_9ZZZZ